MTAISQNDTGSKPRRPRGLTGGAKKVPEAELTALQAQLREKEELLQAKDATLRESEENLKARIHNLEDQLSEKKVPEAELTALQAQLREKEELLQAKDAALGESEENLKARIHNLENQLRERDELLFSREAELKTLRSEADALIQEMSRDKERMLAETEKLESELKEKKLALAKVEEHEWRSIGRRNSLIRRLGKLGKLFGKSSANEEDRKTNDRLPLTSR